MFACVYAHCTPGPLQADTICILERGLQVTSTYEEAAVRELQGAHLNSPSVLVQQEMMFQSVAEGPF